MSGVEPTAPARGKDPTAAAGPPNLRAQHLADLRRSGLSDSTIAAAGIRSLTPAEVKAALGRDAGAGYAIPYPGCVHRDGSPYVRVRLDNPWGEARYLTRKGETPHLYTPPGLPGGWREKTDLRLLLTEGEKKALAATQAGFPCLGLGGVWGWVKKGKNPIGDLSHIAWRGRSVVVVGDSDLAANESARQGLQELTSYLKRRGARARLLILPGEGDSKVGLDDFLLDDFVVASGPGELLRLIEQVEATGLQVSELRDFLALPLPAPEAVVEGMLVRGSVNILFGPPESGKSLLAAECCRAVSAGRPLLGRFPTRAGPTVLIDQENAPSLLQQRLAELERGSPRSRDACPIYILPLQELTLDRDEARADLLAELVPRQPALVVVDTLIAVAGRLDILDAAAVRSWLQYWRGLAVELNAAVLLIAHSPKWAGKEPRLEALFGSVDFGAFVDCAFAATAIPTATERTFRVATVKDRLNLGRVDLTFSIAPGEAGGLTLAAAPSTVGLGHLILEALDEEEWTQGAELTRLATEAGFSDRACRKALAALIAKGLVERQQDPTNRSRAIFRKCEKERE